METHFIYMTAGSIDEATKIGQELVTSKLAACVNILDHMHSIYLWEGEIQDDTEVVIIAKTTEDRVPELIEKVRSMHSYECPCVVAVPIEAGHDLFLKWIGDETREGTSEN